MRFLLFAFCLTLASACTDRSLSPIVPEALEVGTAKTIFAATTRAQEADGTFGPERSEDFNLLELTVSIPPTHSPGKLEFGYGDPKPMKEFTLAAQHRFDQPVAFNRRLKQELATSPQHERDVTVFVHGFNSTHAETAFRAAQLSHDVGIPGATVIYSWPSLGSPLGYAYDGDSILFARDGLERLLRQLKEAGARRIVLVAHSLGSALVMETLRQIEIKTPDWPQRNLGGVILMSPDLDQDVFRSQMSRFDRVPQPFLVFTSQKDTILNISQRIRGTHSRARLGNLKSVKNIADLPIEIIDITEFSDTAESGHFVAATSPALLSLLNAAQKTAQAFERRTETTQLHTLLPGKISRSGDATRIVLASQIEGR